MSGTESGIGSNSTTDVESVTADEAGLVWEIREERFIKGDILDEAAQYLIAGMEVKLTYYKGEPLDIELPTSVDLEVVDSEMAIRGDTATGVTKKVTTSTGLVVMCPQFVKVGDTIRVDTRTGEYVTRV